MPQFPVTVVTHPAIRTAGVKVRTTMQKCAQDCPSLWEHVFGPRMMDFPMDPLYSGVSYGASVMIDNESFDYWAVMPIAAAADTPDGMDILEIPGGLYVECRLESLGQLSDAYNFIFMEWIPAQEKFASNMLGMGLEEYTADYMTNGSLTIYCPLVEK